MTESAHSGFNPLLRHPWGPWGCLSSGVICIWKIYQLFCDSGAALVDFFTLMKMLPNVSFISMVIKKVFLSVSIATISNFLQKCTLWRHNYETSQPKIGQCVSMVAVSEMENGYSIIDRPEGYVKCSINILEKMFLNFWFEKIPTFQSPAFKFMWHNM